MKDGAPRPALGTINVLFAKPRGDERTWLGVMSMVLSPNLENRSQARIKAKMVAMPTLGFSKEDKEGTLKPYDDALVVTIRIRGYDVKRVVVNKGSGVEIMYPNLYKVLNLKPEDLEK